jgi:hypothetical protein
MQILLVVAVVAMSESRAGGVADVELRIHGTRWEGGTLLNPGHTLLQVGHRTVPQLQHRPRAPSNKTTM